MFLVRGMGEYKSQDDNNDQSKYQTACLQWLLRVSTEKDEQQQERSSDHKNEAVSENSHQQETLSQQIEDLSICKCLYVS